MPIEQLSDLRRLSRDFKIRLGSRLIKGEGGVTREPKYDDKKRQREEGGYPKEAEHFVMLPEEVPEDVRDLYGPEPHSLRMMLPMEWDATDPNTGDEMVFNRNNRAYARTQGLRCKGTGYSSEYPGMATTTDIEWAGRIAQASGMAMETVSLNGTKMHRVRCLGADCPKYLRLATVDKVGGGTMTVKAEGVDSDAACKRVFILRAFLLHPTTDTASPDYCRVLGLAEIASSSFNTMINLQSDFPMMRAFTATGTTAGIPFRLERVPIVTFKPTRAVHFVLKVSLDYREVSRWGAVPLAERFQSDELRGRLRAIAATPLALTYDSVSDLMPEDATTETPGSQVQTPSRGGSEASGGPQEAPGTPETETQPDEGGRRLVKGEIDELKALFAAGETEPVRIEGLSRLRDVIALYNAKAGTNYTRFTELTKDVYDFVKDYLTTTKEGQA